MQKIPTNCAAPRRYAAVFCLLAALGSGVGADGTGECRLQAELYGTISTSLDWQGSALHCEGMPRPDGRGARLRFAGTAPGGGPDMAFIIAIPDLPQAAQRGEYSSNVTVIEEGSGRFFSTADLGNCLTDITSVRSLGTDVILINGDLYCVAPLAEINGAASVSVDELNFSGLIDWTAK